MECWEQGTLTVKDLRRAFPGGSHQHFVRALYPSGKLAHFDCYKNIAWLKWSSFWSRASVATIEIIERACVLDYVKNDRNRVPIEIVVLWSLLEYPHVNSAIAIGLQHMGRISACLARRHSLVENTFLTLQNELSLHTLMFNLHHHEYTDQAFPRVTSMWRSCHVYGCTPSAQWHKWRKVFIDGAGVS